MADDYLLHGITTLDGQQVGAETSSADIGNRIYDDNELLTDGETITESLNKVASFISDEFYNEYVCEPCMQNITKQNGVNIYTISQDSNSDTPVDITDGTKIVNDINYIVITDTNNNPIYKQGFLGKLLSQIVKVSSFNPTTREITLNYEPSGNFIVKYLYKYTKKDVPSGKKDIGLIPVQVINNEPANDSDEIAYDNTISGLTSDNVKGAIDELASAGGHTHDNKTVLDGITTLIVTGWDSAVTWISTNGSNLINHLSNTSNPHSVTKTQVGLGNVTDDAQVKKINSSINDNVVTFGATTGDTVKDSGKSINNIAFKNESNTFTADVTIGGTLQVNGNIVQNGASYETHAEQVYTKDNTIILRDGAVAGLGAGEYAGFTAKIYDGTNDGQLVFNKDGIARVGDIGNTQAIATREDNPINGKVPIWNSTTMRFETANSPTTIAGFGITDAITTTGEQTIDGALTLSGLLTANATKAFSGNYTNDITVGESASSVIGYKMNIHSDSGQSMIKFTTTTTGQAATDGLDIGIASNGEAEVRFRENTNMIFYTGNYMHTAFYKGGNIVSVGIFTSYGGIITSKIAIKGDGNSIGADSALAITGYSLNAYTASAAKSMFKFTNSITGQTVTDGTDIGITGDGSFEIRQRENKPLNIYTNNALAATFEADKSFTLPHLAGTGSRMVVADSTGNLRASDCCLDLTTGNNVSIKISKNTSLANNIFSDLFNFYSSGGFASANYIGAITGELRIKILGLTSSYLRVDSYRTFYISARQHASGNITITNIATKDTFDNDQIPTVTVREKSGNTNTSSKIEVSVTFTDFLECNVLAEIECLSMSNLSNNLIRLN